MVSMALDRVVAIKFPFTHRNYTSKRTATIMATVAIIAGYLIPSGWHVQNSSLKRYLPLRGIFYHLYLQVRWKFPYIVSWQFLQQVKNVKKLFSSSRLKTIFKYNNSFLYQNKLPRIIVISWHFSSPTVFSILKFDNNVTMKMIT